ncbi:MAG: UDP-N-acetylmuramate:L-alanyl-gamma-D-glutamyl-meso-diaminopimelate ligase [Proteobacteria bacterium]|nr:MAG: UDP-N-acetylmuramate:L-alanyl-gamma-D-glutamyl-meso-diaminopimelate ligase [Pseudomonadota bacterium]
MNLHILGICGTFMAGIAQIARQLGHRVSGSDANTYPPMSTLLESLGITVQSGYRSEHIPESTDCCIVGNAMMRGNPEVEFMLDTGLAYTSGPEWLQRHVLADRSVIAIAGTHGKTTTTSMVCHALDHSGHDCGFLVGGVPGNFDVSARLGTSPWFVIEADEYDTAFFDKRSKFVHYRPRIALLNNLEFDHADIFSDIEQIKIQFHHLVRTIPRSGTIVLNDDDESLADALSRGCWSRVARFAPRVDACEKSWRIAAHRPDYSTFDIVQPDSRTTSIEWNLFGAHNAANALAAAVVCHAAGLAPGAFADAMRSFTLPRRRMQLLGERRGIRIYEDFAHHPTAIRGTLKALSAKYPESRIIAVVEPRSNTMRNGCHNEALGDALSGCAHCMLLRDPDMEWSPADLVDAAGDRPCVGYDDVGKLLNELLAMLRHGDVVALMSNGSFQGLPVALVRALDEGAES